MEKAKFEFDISFQELLLSYTVQDKNGHKALELYNDYYFTLLHHQVIAYCLKRYHKNSKKVIQSEPILREELRKVYQLREFKESLTNGDKEAIGVIVKNIFKTIVKHGDDLLKATAQFSAYVSLKNTLEDIDLKDFTQYENFSTKITKSIAIGKNVQKKPGTLLIRDVRERQFNRAFHDNIHPTPYWQLNRLSNSGQGYSPFVGVLLAPEKSFKTGMLINFSVGYLKQRKKLLYIDLENGEDAISTRFEQSLNGLNKKEVISGEFDQKISKQLRKFRRLGAEVKIVRLPGYSTNANTIQNIIDDDYNDLGIRYDGLIVDFVGLLGSLSGKKDDNERISDAYVDIKNLTEKNGFLFCWTGHHTKREARKREGSKFESCDTAKCIDITRHVDIIIGLQQNEQEAEAGVLRGEIIEQRDGPPQGKMLFWINHDIQRVKEFTRVEVGNYVEQVKEEVKTNKRGDL